MTAPKQKKYQVPDELIYGTDPNEKELACIAKVREALEQTEIFLQHEEEARKFLTTTVYHRFLTSRKYDFKKSLQRLEKHLEWRFVTWKPHLLRLNDIKDYNEFGCMQVSPRGGDRFGRPIVLIDTKKMKNIQTGKEKFKEDLTLLCYTLELATKQFTAKARRYVVFMDLSGFSLKGNPPRAVQRQVTDMLGTQFPETLGLGIIYGAPFVFNKVFDLFKTFMAESTLRKIIFVPTKVKEGSTIDQKLCAYVGGNWRLLLGISLEPTVEGGARGYNHDTYWTQIEYFEDEYHKE